MIAQIHVPGGRVCKTISHPTPPARPHCLGRTSARTPAPHHRCHGAAVRWDPGRQRTQRPAPWGWATGRDVIDCEAVIIWVAGRGQHPQQRACQGRLRAARGPPAITITCPPASGGCTCAAPRPPPAAAAHGRGMVGRGGSGHALRGRGGAALREHLRARRMAARRGGWVPATGVRHAALGGTCTLCVCVCTYICVLCVSSQMERAYAQCSQARRTSS